MIEAALTSLPGWDWAPLVHLVCGLLGAVILSGVVVKAILTGLRYLNEGGEVPRDAFALPTGPGLASAGLLIGGFERVLTYLALVGGAPLLLGVASAPPLPLPSARWTISSPARPDTWP